MTSEEFFRNSVLLANGRLTPNYWIDFARRSYIRGDIELEAFEGVVHDALFNDARSLTTLLPGEFVARP